MTWVKAPSIDWINANAGSNGLNCISTFAGCGGSSTGYKWAGFKVLKAVEFMPKAAETYRLNAPSTHVIEGNIRELAPLDLLDGNGLGVGDLDVLDGSPPCQAFSTAGLREKGWGKDLQYSDAVAQRSDDLFFEFVRMIDGLQPKVFVAENVAGLAYGTAAGYFKEIFGELQKAGTGYNVGAQILDAQYLGVPQKRQRLIMIGVRNDLGKAPVFPKKINKEPLRFGDCVADLPEPEKGQFAVLKPGTRTHSAWAYSKPEIEGGCFRNAYIKLYGKDARYMWFRCSPAEPLPTVTAKIPSLFRWDVPRSFSIAEIKRASSFPDDFQLTGNFSDQWERVGRAVPPAMMKAVAETIAKEIFGK